MKTAALIRKTLSPVIGLGIALMIVGGGLLVFEGHWAGLWPGLLALTIYPVLFPLLLVPGGTAAVISAQQAAAYPRVAICAQGFAVAYFCAAMSLYTIFSFNMVAGYLEGPTLLHAIAWAIGAAVLPWALFATRDKENVFFIGLVLLMLVMSFAVAVAGLCFHLSLWQAFFFMWGGMTGVMFLLMGLEQFLFRRQKKA